MRYATVALVSIRRSMFAALFLAVGVCVPSSLRAQQHVLIVSIADATSGKPLEGAQVRLPDTGRQGRADWIGEVKFSDVSAGAHLVTVRMVGYAPGEIKVLVAGDSTGAVFMLEPTATTTDTVRVVAESEKVPARLFEFEAHKKMGVARILPESVLAKLEPDRLSLAIATRFPGLAVTTQGGHSSVMSLRQSGDLHYARCGIAMFLDGLPMTGDVYEMLDPKSLAGIEFYPIGMAPLQYRRAGEASKTSNINCVVLLFWSK